MRGLDVGDTAHYPVAAGALGGVKRLVGHLHQARQPIHLFVARRYANADGGRMCHFSQWTFGDVTTQALRDDLGIVQIGFGQQHRKFFTADPGEHVTCQPYYEVKVSVHVTKFPEKVREKLKPGMMADVLIATGERTVLAYLTQPMTDAIRRGMRED